jgi:hypothetical protein
MELEDAVSFFKLVAQTVADADGKHDDSQGCYFCTCRRCVA